MSCRSLGSLALLAAGLLAGACQEGAPTAPAETRLALEAQLGAAGDAAALSGDSIRAVALRHAASALRWGIRPSQIDVKVHNETVTYLAIVVGMERRLPGGDRVLVRSLIAWTGRPPTALLQVVSASDAALFGQADNGNGDHGSGPPGARGHWKDLVARQLWIATAGSADLELAGTGGDCPIQPVSATLHCVLASYDVLVNGSFSLQTGDGGPIEIHTHADGVHGVVIKLAD